MSAPNALQSTVKLYHSVIEEVIGNVKEAFLDEGVDDAVLHELKQIWESKVLASKAVDSLDPNQAKTIHTNSVQESSSSHRVIRQVQLDTRIQQKTAKSFEAFHHTAEYNPSTSNREIPMLQAVSSGFMSSTDGLNTRPISSLVHCVPQQSVITNAQNGIFLQMQGVQKSFPVQQTNNSIFPNPLTSSLMLTSSGRGSLDKRPGVALTSSLTVPGSNVIVAPSFHLQASMARPDQSALKTAAVNNARTSQRQKVIVQLDGPGVMTDDEEDDSIDEEDVELNVDSVAEEASSAPVEEGDALNSEDDEVSNENADEMFEADDVVVCQFEKVSRIRNKWKFILKDGIINLGRKDYVFNKALGEAEF